MFSVQIVNQRIIFLEIETEFNENFSEFIFADTLESRIIGGVGIIGAGGGVGNCNNY